VNREEEPAPETTEERARSYSRRKRLLALADFLLGVALLVMLLASGATHALRDWALRLGSHLPVALWLYFVVFTAFFQALGLPLDFWRGYRLEHQFKLSRQSFPSWLWDWLKAALLSFLFGLLAVQVIYAALARWPATWWLVCAAAFTFFFLAMAQLAPVLLYPLFFKFEPLRDDELKQRLLRLSERVGAQVRGVFLWKLGEKSRKANAALAGWGRTRRILLADTLVEKHAPEEIEVILAHELAHHVHHDIGKGLLLQTALTFLSFYAVHRALAAWTVPLGFSGPADFANLPLLVLVSGAVALAALPAANAFSRHLERQADAFALRATGDRDAFIGAMEKLAAQNLAQRRPHPWIEFFFHSHPSIEKRVAFARAWQAGA